METTHTPLAADGVATVPSSLRDEMVWRDCSAEADGLKPTATFGPPRRPLRPRPRTNGLQKGRDVVCRGATFDGSRGFQPTDADDARMVRRGATREWVETTTRIHWADDGVAMVHSSLRDEIVWRDGSAEADGWKPTATFGPPRRTLRPRPRTKSRLRGRVCEFQKLPLRAWELENGPAAISESRTPDPAFSWRECGFLNSS